MLTLSCWRRLFEPYTAILPGPCSATLPCASSAQNLSSPSVLLRTGQFSPILRLLRVTLTAQACCPLSSRLPCLQILLLRQRHPPPPPESTLCHGAKLASRILGSSCNYMRATSVTPPDPGAHCLQFREFYLACLQSRNITFIRIHVCRLLSPLSPGPYRSTQTLELSDMFYLEYSSFFSLTGISRPCLHLYGLE